MTVDNRAHALTRDDPLGFSQRRARRASLWGLLRVFWRWHERSRQRHQLAALDDHMLRDIGLTRGQATQEAARPYWPI